MSAYSLDDLKTALVNADAAGDAESARMLAAAIQDRMGSESAPAALPPAPLKIGAEGLPDAVKAVVGDFSPLSQLAVGAKAGWDQAAMRLKQLTGGTLTPEEENTVKANRALVDESRMALLGKLGFDVGATAVPAAGAYGGITGLLSRFIPQALAKSAAAGAVGAGAAGLMEPTVGNESTLQNMKSGGIGGVLADAVLRGAGRLAQPVVASPKVQELLNRDIVPTVGQAMDEGTLLGRMVKSGEEKLQSVPFLGDVIRNARMRPHEEVNLAAIKTVYPDAKDIGHKGIQAAEDYANGLYETALGKFTNGVAPDKAFLQQTFDAKSDPTLLLTKGQRRQVSDFIDKVILKKFDPSNHNAMPADMAKKIDSELGTKVRELMGSPSAAEKDLGRAFQNVQTSFRSLINRNAPTPEVAAELADANRRWANFVRVRDAASSSGAKEGVFTPAQLQAAVRRGDASAGKGRFAQGEALLQDLSGPAKSVLGETVPDSGTAGRAILAHILAHPIQSTIGLPLSLASAIPYSRLGQQYMLGQFATQGALAGAAREAAPYGAAAGGILNQRPQWAGADQQ